MNDKITPDGLNEPNTTESEFANTQQSPSLEENDAAETIEPIDIQEGQENLLTKDQGVIKTPFYDDVASDEAYQPPVEAATEKPTEANSTESGDFSNYFLDRVTVETGGVVFKINPLYQESMTRNFDGYPDMRNALFLPAATWGTTKAYVAYSQSIGVEKLRLTPREGADHLALATEVDVRQRVEVEAPQIELDTPTREWRQGLVYDGKRMTAVSGKIHDSSGKLTGVAAIQAVRSSIDGGISISIPFYHSGFWITINTPSLGDQLALWESVNYNENIFARQTRGLPGSSVNAFFLDQVYRLVQANIINTSMVEIGDLSEKISSLDIPTLYWAALTACFPRGHEYHRVVPIANITSQVYEHGKIDFSKLDLVDAKAFTEKQKAFMQSAVRKKTTEAERLEYVAGFDYGSTKLVKLNDHLQIELTIPSLADVLKQGRKWLDSTSGDANRIMRMEISDADKLRKTNMLFNSQRGKQYSPYVRQIITPLGAIDNPIDIEAATETFVEDAGLYEKYIEAVTTEIAKKSVVQYAIPAYAKDVNGQPLEVDFPKKGAVDYNRFGRAIPLDLSEVFLISLGQKATLIQTLL